MIGNCFITIVNAAHATNKDSTTRKQKQQRLSFISKNHLMLASKENARNATFERHTRSQSKNWTFSNSMHTTKLFAHDLLKGPKKSKHAHV